MTLAELRRALVAAKETLRAVKDELETTKTIATLNTTGSNDRERKKADDQALLDNNDYRRTKAHLINCENLIDEIEAEIDILKDERTARALACRERANEVLDRLAAAYERMAPTDSVALERSAIDTALPF